GAREMALFAPPSSGPPRLRAPSDTSTTPGRPTARCTMSRLRLPLTASVTVQPPRMFFRIATAAPGCPASIRYCARCASCPKTIMPTASAVRIPIGTKNHSRPKTTPIRTTTTRAPAAEANTMGRAFGSALRSSWATMRICLRRPGRSWTASVGFFDMVPRIVVSRGTAPSGLPRLDRLLVQAAGAVAGAHQRARHDAREADLLRLGGQLHELLGLHPPLDRVVAGAGPQVLGDRDELAAGGRQVPPGPEGGPDPLEDPRDGLHVVRQHLRPGREHLGQQLGHRVEVGDEQLDAAAGVGGVDLPDGLGVQPGAAVVEVVARDAGDRGVLQAHLRDGLGDAAGLVPVEFGGPAGVDLAEVAAARALVAADEERGLPVLPAFVDVGAAGLLAHGVQALGLHQAVELAVLRAHLHPGLDPLGLALDRGLAVARLDAQELASLRCHRRHGTQRTARSADRHIGRARLGGRASGGRGWAGAAPPRARTRGRAGLKGVSERSRTYDGTLFAPPIGVFPPCPPAVISRVTPCRHATASAGGPQWVWQCRTSGCRRCWRGSRIPAASPAASSATPTGAGAQRRNRSISAGRGRRCTTSSPATRGTGGSPRPTWCAAGGCSPRTAPTSWGWTRSPWRRTGSSRPPTI